MANILPPEQPAVKYERRDVYVGWTLAVLGIFALFGAVLHYAIWTFLWSEQHDQAAARRMGFPLAEHPSRQLPPQPRLEPLEPSDEERRAIMPPSVAVRAEQLHSYGKTDDPGYIHVPIARAIEHLAGKLPVRKQSDKPERADSGLLDAGESNSGRLFRKAPP